jgi:hypothetical protein
MCRYRSLFGVNAKFIQMLCTLIAGVKKKQRRLSVGKVKNSDDGKMATFPSDLPPLPVASTMSHPIPAHIFAPS